MTTTAEQRTQFLPHFSDARDIDEFVTALESFERGEISPDKFRMFRLARGVYGQRQPDVQMIRLKIPQGALGADQLIAIADAVDASGRDICHLTTRQNVQIHFVPMDRVEAALRALDTAGLTTREACGNTVRNVTGDPLSGVAADTVFDVRPYGEAIARHLLRQDYDQSLPRKFKIALSASEADRAMTSINDAGFIAREREGVRGFKVVAAGGLSTNPMNAVVLHEFLPVAEVLDSVEAIVRLFDLTGNRDNKHRARLKYVVKKHGAERFVEMYNEQLAAVRARGGTPLSTIAITDEPEPPARMDQEPVHTTRRPGYLAWRASSTAAQLQEGYVTAAVRLPLGDITPAQLRALAPIARDFSNGIIHATLEQNLLLRWVALGRLPALHAALEDIGLARNGAQTVEDVTSCPGADSCQLAVTTSRQLGNSISERMDAMDADAREALELARSATIKISGCPNSCGQHHVADLGFHGAVKRLGDKSAPVYQLHLGGGVDGASGATFGRQVVKIPARRVAECVERLLQLFKSDRTTQETPRDFFRRVTSERVVEVLGSLTVLDETASELDFVDLGQEEGFEVKLGKGECAA
ncbi:MAG: nitrite/sulfite reductase [Deltaproteobacteria bacterium]|nr:nitrite/sulfite reductase [Deltaproteobacteria bacterium]